MKSWMDISGVSSNRHCRAWPGNPFLETMATRVRPACDGSSILRLLRFPLLDRPAGVAPRRKTAAHVRDRLQPHVVGGFCRERRAHAAGAVKDELLVLLKNRLGVGARRVDPEFQHAAGAGERARNFSITFDLAGIADIDDHHIIAFCSLDGL